VLPYKKNETQFFLSFPLVKWHSSGSSIMHHLLLKLRHTSIVILVKSIKRRRDERKRYNTIQSAHTALKGSMLAADTVPGGILEVDPS
jgi:hypothetical protein